jgi:predicted  nucleic acid-binding Zn-ribbon protein
LKNGRNKAAQSFFHEEAEEVNGEEEEVNEEENLQDEVKSIVIFRNGFIYMSM